MIAAFIDLLCILSSSTTYVGLKWMVILRFSAAARVIAKKQRVQPEVKLFTTLNVCHKAESSLPPESMRMVDHNSAAPRVGKDNVPTANHPKPSHLLSSPPYHPTLQ